MILFLYQKNYIYYFLYLDREQVEEVEREISDRKHKLEFVIRCLNEEIKARGMLIAAIEQADSFYTTQRGEVKVVANVSVFNIINIKAYLLHNLFLTGISKFW